jgi:hypothetical protein
MANGIHVAAKWLALLCLPLGSKYTVTTSPIGTPGFPSVLKFVEMFRFQSVSESMEFSVKKLKKSKTCQHKQ